MEDNEMDHYDPDEQPGLTCDIEIDTMIGETPREVYASVAWALRDLAAKIEKGVLDSGHHPIQIPSGEKIGEVYLDHYSGT